MKREDFNFKMWAALCALSLSVGFSSERRTMESPDGNLIASVTHNVEGVSNDYEQSSVIRGELRTPKYRTIQLEGIGYDPKLGRQDPSNVIKVGNKYYVFTSTFTGGNVYQGNISYATSTDGIKWEDKGIALIKGPYDAWDNFGVLTPYIMVYQGNYYLYYTSSREISGENWHIRGPNNGRHIGLAIANSPDGPWEKMPLPILSPGKDGEWDSYLVDDAHVIVRNGQFWLYYKGGDIKVTGGTTRWGVAIADNPKGPFVKHEMNPLIGGHTVCVWPHREGVAALVDNAGPERHTVQWSPDGLHFQRAAKIESGVHTGCGPYDPDAHANVSFGHGITWGVAQERGGGRMYIVRFEVDCLAPTSQTKDTTSRYFRLELDNKEPAVDFTPFHPRMASCYQDKRGVYHLFTDYMKKGVSSYNAVIRYYKSNDLYQWEYVSTVAKHAEIGVPDAKGCSSPHVYATDDKIYLFYGGTPESYNGKMNIYAKKGEPGYMSRSIILAIAKADKNGAPIGDFVKQVILEPGDMGDWDAMRLDGPCAIIVGDTLHLYYDAFDCNKNRERVQVGYAKASINDLKFKKNPNPILLVPGGAEMPRVFRIGDKFHMVIERFGSCGYLWWHYTSVNGINWQLHDPYFFKGHPAVGPPDIMMIYGMNGQVLDIPKFLVAGSENGINKLWLYSLKEKISNTNYWFKDTKTGKVTTK